MGVVYKFDGTPTSDAYDVSGTKRRYVYTVDGVEIDLQPSSSVPEIGSVVLDKKHGVFKIDLTAPVYKLFYANNKHEPLPDWDEINRYALNELSVAPPTAAEIVGVDDTGAVVGYVPLGELKIPNGFTPSLTLGVVADAHVGLTTSQATAFANALDALNGLGCNHIVSVGDITNNAGTSTLPSAATTTAVNTIKKTYTLPHTVGVIPKRGFYWSYGSHENNTSATTTEETRDAAVDTFSTKESGAYKLSGAYLYVLNFRNYQEFYPKCFWDEDLNAFDVFLNKYHAEPVFVVQHMPDVRHSFNYTKLDVTPTAPYCGRCGAYSDATDITAPMEKYDKSYDRFLSIIESHRNVIWLQAHTHDTMYMPNMATTYSTVRDDASRHNNIETYYNNTCVHVPSVGSVRTYGGSIVDGASECLVCSISRNGEVWICGYNLSPNEDGGTHYTPCASYLIKTR